MQHAGRDESLTLQAVAAELGVHYMTAYRYVRLGLLDAEKVGSSWRIEREALERFRLRGAEPPAPDARRSAVAWWERYEARLVDGDAQGAWSVVEAAMSAGSDPTSIYVDVLAPAMHHIGERWATGEIGVEVEHRATVIAWRTVGRLGPRFNRRGTSRGTMVIGSAPLDYHCLATAVVSDLVRGAGFDVIDLGANTPSSSFVTAARGADRLAAVGVSVATDASRAAAREVIDAVRAALPEVRIIVGGPASSDDLGADRYVVDGREAVALLQEG